MTKRVLILGARGMVGSAVVRCLRGLDYQLLTPPRAQLDLCNQATTSRFFLDATPDIVVLAAAKVGGIQANLDYPARFLHDNLAIAINVLEAASRQHPKPKLVYLGSSCCYPRLCDQPMKEEHLLTGPLEPTNEGYALAKIAGLKLVDYYRRQYDLSGVTVMPCNLYGPNDNFDKSGHVLASLVRRFVDAVKQQTPAVTVWGTGEARREFMHVDDCAAAILQLLLRKEIVLDPSWINVGWGEDVTIRELAQLIATATGYGGEILWDKTKPDGMPRKCLDVTRMNHLGWRPEIDLAAGVRQLVQEYTCLATIGTP